MTKIFISYRREDSADVTGRIGDSLRDHFGEEQIFIDVDNTPLGVDFRTHLDNEVSQCDVLLAVIGKDWLSAKYSDGELQLNDPADFVRIEIESALRRDIPVIPLLVHGASIPPSDQLPESIEALAYRNAQKIRPDPDFKNDANRLVQSLTKHREQRPSRFPWLHNKDIRLIGVGAIASVVGAIVVLNADLFFSSPVTNDNSVDVDGENQGAGEINTGEPQQVSSLPETGRAIPTTQIPAKDFIDPKMVAIRAGTFTMGSDAGDANEQPVHQVTVPAFELARDELTWAEWQACEDADGCEKIKRPLYFEQIQGSHPVVNVSFANANEYLSWISSRTGRSYRLPSEAESEYSTRAGSTTTYYWGDAIGENQGNCDGCGSPWDGQSTAPVGSFGNNPFGLNDVHGNVLEWVADCWHKNYDDAPADGSAWVDDCTDANRKVVRGGSWKKDPKSLRSAERSGYDSGGDHYDVGFRLARTLP